MKVILNSDIKGVEKKNEIINASDGYARNYLFPRNLAIPADKQNLNVWNAKKSAADRKRSLEKEEAIKAKERLEKAVLTIKTKAGENRKNFWKHYIKRNFRKSRKRTWRKSG